MDNTTKGNLSINLRCPRCGKPFWKSETTDGELCRCNQENDVKNTEISRLGKALKCSNDNTQTIIDEADRRIEKMIQELKDAENECWRPIFSYCKHCKNYKKVPGIDMLPCKTDCENAIREWLKEEDKK